MIIITNNVFFETYKPYKKIKSFTYVIYMVKIFYRSTV